jgi:hypothetical protein
MNSMKRTTYGLRRARAASAGISGSVKPRIATQLTLIGRSSGCRSASASPARTRSSAAAGDLGEAHVRERVQRDVDAPEPGRDERRGEAVEQHAVGRERQVAHTRCRSQHPHELGQVAPHERLAAGQPDLLDAHGGHHRYEPLDLLEREQLGLGQPRQAFRGHAVAAAEVAAVGDRDAQAADRAAPAVPQWGRRRRVRRRQLGGEDAHGSSTSTKFLALESGSPASPGPLTRV